MLLNVFFVIFVSSLEYSGLNLGMSDVEDAALGQNSGPQIAIPSVLIPYSFTPSPAASLVRMRLPYAANTTTA